MRQQQRVLLMVRSDWQPVSKTPAQSNEPRPTSSRSLNANPTNLFSAHAKNSEARNSFFIEPRSGRLKNCTQAVKFLKTPRWRHSYGHSSARFWGRVTNRGFRKPGVTPRDLVSTRCQFGPPFVWGHDLPPVTKPRRRRQNSSWLPNPCCIHVARSCR